MWSRLPAGRFVESVLAWLTEVREHACVARAAPSEELRSFLLRFYRALETGDAAALGEMFSAEPHLLIVGSDAEEWWTGRDGVGIFIAQIDGMAGVALEPSRTMAFATDSIGWVADQPLMRLADGTEIRTRVTAVLAIERGHWRMVQWHFSIPQANEAVLGFQLPTGIEMVEQTVRDDRPDLTPISAPDGTVTIVFSDIESSTALNERLGDTDFVQMLAWHDRIVTTTAEQHRGFVVKSEGDGFMLAFPSAASALRAALSVREQIREGFSDVPVRVRLGLHSGEAIRRADDFYGRTVVIAARVSSHALGDEILASSLVHELARGLGTFDFGPPRTTTFKGLDGDFIVYPVLA